MEKKPIHECQCDGPGHCSVYNADMNQSRYNKCKNDASWRRHYHKFFASLNGDSVQSEIKLKMEQMERKARRIQDLEYELQLIQKDEEIELQKKFKAYYQQEYKKIVDGFIASLSPEELELYENIKTSLKKKQDERLEAQTKLKEVVDKLKEEGIDLEQDVSAVEGVGDIVQSTLSKLGITEDVINKWSGLKGGCGCGKRHKFLNKILPFNKNKE